MLLLLLLLCFLGFFVVVVAVAVVVVVIGEVFSYPQWLPLHLLGYRGTTSPH